MAKGDIHTSKQGHLWINKPEGDECASSCAPTKAQAQAAGRQMAIERGVEHFVHKENGEIGERNTYPAQPRPPVVQGLTGTPSHSESPCGTARPRCS